MITLRQLLAKIADDLAEPIPSDGSGVKEDRVCPVRVELLDRQSALHSDILYLGDASSAGLLTGAVAESGTIVMLVGAGKVNVPDGVSLFRLSCTLPRLFNRISAALYETAGEAGEDRARFQRCWDSIVEHRLTGADEIRRALAEQKYPVSNFVAVATVSFRKDDERSDYEQLLEQLQILLPETNMMVYRNEIVILHSYPERQFSLHLPSEEEISATLDREDAFLCISNGTRNLATLPLLYSLTRQTSVLARQLAQHRQKRIFTVDEYSVYNIIDLCAQRYRELHRSDDIIYLIHPAVIHLTRYDKKHNSNLRDVLFYYLLNDRNLLRTATATYMHRNTIVNKVNKIQELLNLDLDDGHLCQRLIFSCQVILYYENVMHQNLKL